MKKQPQNEKWSRRGFLRGAGLLGMGGAVAALAEPPLTDRQVTKSSTTVAPPAYDVERLRKTDPKLIAFEQTGQIRCPRNEPKRIVLGPEDKLYVAAEKYVSVLDKTGKQLFEVTASQEVRCLAVDKDGTLYAGLRDQIEVFAPDGQRIKGWNTPGKKPWLTSLAVGANDLFAADAANRIVYHLDRSGKLLGRLGEKNKERGISGFLVPSPYFDLEIGSDGLLWVANPGYHRLEAYTFSGDLQSSWGQPSFGVAGFCGCCNPSYFTRLPDGRFVTSEKGLARVKVYSSKGEFESVVAGAEAFPKYFENPNATPVAVDVAVDSGQRIFVADTLANEIRIYQRKKS